ncbi:MAG: HAD-IA family hydrolase [Paludibacterium sp.]|uniref:HAD-IA family hydrolase n=1 Tax=Paludibacterium sp. TaxID=1917523 RepID=UPI0025D0940D|nr:HAD-IA family hydrolase [Paludibacterium sp.]MBV8045542.1 HAD-IA family hydrolase [Paludibacterium sp.]
MQWQPDTVLNARALLFDMDGTLVNSIAVVEKIWLRFAAQHGLDGAHVLANIHGRKAIDSMRAFLPADADIAGETARLTEEEVADTDGVVEIPGAARLLAALPAGSWALVTSASPALAESRLRAAGLPLPPVMITGDDVTRGKPDPQGYLAAAAALGVSPADCIVFEDAPVGLQAGHAAGMQVVAITTTLSDDALAQERWLRDYRRLDVRAVSGRLELSLTPCAEPVAG